MFFSGLGFAGRGARGAAMWGVWPAKRGVVVMGLGFFGLGVCSEFFEREQADVGDAFGFVAVDEKFVDATDAVAAVAALDVFEVFEALEVEADLGFAPAGVFADFAAGEAGFVLVEFALVALFADHGFDRF